jgi:integrase
MTYRARLPGPAGGRLRHFKRAYARAVRAAAGLAGTKVTVYCLRHIWASRMVESGADLVLLKELGGWASLLMVQRYSHYRPERRLAAIAALVEARDRALQAGEPGGESHRISHRRIGGAPRTS